MLATGLALAALLLTAPAPPVSPNAPTIETIKIEGVRLGRRTSVRVRLGIKSGSPLDEAAVEEARLRLLETGRFKRVEARLERGSARGQVALVFDCEERQTFSLDAVHLGHARPTPLWGGAEVSDLDPFGLGFSLGAGIVSGGGQHALTASAGLPTLLGDGWGLQLRLLWLDGQEPFVGPVNQWLDNERVADIPVGYTRRGAALNLGRALGPTLRLNLTARVEALGVTRPANATQDDGDGRRLPFDFQAEDGTLGVLSASLSYDSRDDPAFPSRGVYANAQVRGGYAWAPYAASLLTIERYQPLPRGHILRLDARLGLLAGDAPFFERFFIGDLHPYIPERALGLNFARRRGPNLLDTGIVEQRYESLAARLGVEYRVPLSADLDTVTDNGDHRLEFFVGAALVSLGSPDTLSGLDPMGRRVPIDATLDIGLRLETAYGVAGLSLGNVLLLVDP